MNDLKQEEAVLFNLNKETPNAIKRFMLDNQLFTYADIGKKVDLSRERIRQIFANRSDLDFKEIKRSVVREKFKEEKTKMYKWKLITFVNTKHPYYVSECGLVARDIVYKKHGIEITKRKLLKPSANKSKYLRVNLTLVSEQGQPNEHKTFYLQQIVGNEFLPKPESSRSLKGVTFRDGDVTNCHKDNLMWSYHKNK